jgi:hypothetical protein
VDWWLQAGLQFHPGAADKGCSQFLSQPVTGCSRSVKISSQNTVAVLTMNPTESAIEHPTVKIPPLGFLVLALLSSVAYGRDVGYALECSAADGSSRQLITFLENGVNKRVRYLESGNRAMWDSHEWNDTAVTVRSMVQIRGEGEPKVEAYVEIDTRSLRARFIRLGGVAGGAAAIDMQCQRWRPETRNK